MLNVRGHCAYGLVSFGHQKPLSYVWEKIMFWLEILICDVTVT